MQQQDKSIRSDCSGGALQFDRRFGMRSAGFHRVDAECPKVNCLLVVPDPTSNVHLCLRSRV